MFKASEFSKNKADLHKPHFCKSPKLAKFPFELLLKTFIKSFTVVTLNSCNTRGLQRNISGAVHFYCSLNFKVLKIKFPIKTIYGKQSYSICVLL